MSHLKFRVWDKKTKKMSPQFGLFGEFTLLGDWQRKMGNVATDSLSALNDLEIMQCTGEMDANGVLMFEGDILDARGDGGSVYDDIVFGSGCFCMNKAIMFSELSYGVGKGIVVGNIYENPELL